LPLPEWIPRLRAIGGEACPWATVQELEEFLPYGGNTDRQYRAANRYIKRVEKERARHRSYLLPVDALYARDNELPAKREGRNIYVVKELLIIKLLGYDPRAAA